MAKLTGFNRRRSGHRNYQALLQAPPATVDEYGQVSYSDGAWTTIMPNWWCELVDLGGGEILDGAETKTATEKVAIGDNTDLGGRVNTKCRCIIDGVTYGITAIRDVSGDNMTLRVELKATKQ